MTRINVVPVETIHTKQLQGEYVELPHVFSHVRRMLDAGRTSPVAKVPERYTMGPGHVAFFMDKLEFLAARYVQIWKELEKRGFTCNPRHLRNEFFDIPPWYWGTYEPDAEALRVNQERIDQRLSEREQRRITGERYDNWR